MESPTKEKNILLIVDDKPANIGILFEFLEGYGFEILVAENGIDAVESAVNGCPDLILLDILMPGIDGFETCHQLKSQEQTKEIPIIFMTALSDTLDKIRGFELGAVDYITKPFRQEEVLARINTHLTIRRLQHELQLKNNRLMVFNNEKDELLGIAAHDLKNPLANIQGVAELFKNSIDELSKEQMFEYLDMIQRSAKQMFELVKNLLDVNAIEAGKVDFSTETVDLRTPLKFVMTRYLETAKSKSINLQLELLAESPYNVCINQSVFFQIMENLISNAIKYSPVGKQVTVELNKRATFIRCTVSDEGPGLNEKDQKKLFNKFSRLTPRPTAGEHSTGLGLFIVKKLTEAMQGQVWCESELGRGSRFTVEFPEV